VLGYAGRVSERLLIAVGDATSSPDHLPSGVRLLVDEADEILVISPTLPDRLQWLSSDTDRATREADERLEKVLGQLSEIGAEAQGAVGADDPLLAFEDAVARFSPSHILIALRRHDRAGWQERGLVEALLERIRVPITVFDLPDA
jgi:hypothetical protein